jgi:transcriptional regulator with XRE-family HTH domain
VTIMTSRELGARIRTARELANFTQEELATALHCSQPSIAHWEAGKREVSPLKLHAIAHLTEQDITFFFPTDGRHPRPSEARFEDALRKLGALDPHVRAELLSFLQLVLDGPSHGGLREANGH